MYISTLHGPREGLQRYQDHIDHHLLSFDHNGETITTWQKKDGISPLFHQSFFDSLPTTRFDCIWFFFFPHRWWWIGICGKTQAMVFTPHRIVRSQAQHTSESKTTIQDRANNVSPIIIKLWNFWQRGRLWFGFSESSGSIWLFFNNNASLAPPPWFDITISLMIAYLQYLHFILSP